MVGLNSYNSPCIIRFGGSVAESVAVDTWRVRDVGLYICTHAHADHTFGLSDSWDLGQVVCTAPTLALLVLKWPGLERRLTALPLDEPVRAAYSARTRRAGADGPSPSTRARERG
jgi:glyoxylase-like metal-dependent hydrolase (beta-lactamase superfamily II)